MIPVDVVIDAGDQLGEGPLWDDLALQLLRVDITRGLVHAWNPADGAAATIEAGGQVSAVLPRRGRPDWLLAVGHEIVLGAPDARTVLATVETDRDHNRFNDCKCDPQGRLWAGTMSTKREPGVAALYRIDPDGAIETMVTGTTISNGLGWSPAGDTMYFIDSTTQRLDAFDFDGDRGAIANRRVVAEIDPTDGLPDGLTIDADGGIWLCLFGGGALRRYAPDGTLDVHVDLPVTNPTCPGFGGRELDTLYVTSARHRLSDEQLAAEPLAGAVLGLDPGVRGMPAHRFAG